MNKLRKDLIKERLTVIFQSEKYKKIIFITGFIFMILTGFIIIDPKPFLRLGYLGVFIFNLFGPGTFLIPILARSMNIFLLASVTSLGMAFNDSVSWYIGKNGQTILPKGKRVQQIESGIKKFGPLALFVWSIIPFPYDLIGLISGYLGVSYLGFFIPTFLGKFLRFILLGTGTVSIFGKTN